MTSFSEALEKRERVPCNAHGENIDIGEAPHDQLVDVFLFLKEHEQKFKEWRTAVEDELVRRHGDRRAAQTVGSFEVDVDRGMSRQWDVEDLMSTVSDLVQRGLLTVADVEGVVREKREMVVNGVKAKALIDRAEEETLLELRRCFTWKKGRAKVRVTPVVELEA